MERLLFILEHLNIGGAERSLVDILNHLDYSKYEVDLLLYQGKGVFESEIPPQVNIAYYPTEDAFGRITTVFLKALRRRDWFSLRFRFYYFMEWHFGKGYMKRAGKLFEKMDKEYDCAISSRPGQINNALLAYSFKSKKKIVWWHHGELGMREDERQKLEDIYQHIDCMVAVSRFCDSIVKESFSLEDERRTVIPNMICIDRLVRKAKEYEVPHSNNKLMLCSVGRFSPEKNMTICPEIGKKLQEKGVDFVWYLIGDGDQLDEVKAEVVKLGLDDLFVFTGQITSPYPYVAAADIFIHPSLVESQGIAILEAMALRTPVVVVNSGGPGEYIESGKNGYLVNNDVDEICDAVQQLFNSEDNNKALVENAYQTALRFSPEKIVPLLDDLFTV